jgi:PAS domain S-box-containing protein
MNSDNKSKRMMSFLARFIVPTVSTIVLFLTAIFLIIIPIIEKNNIDRKKEMIRELTTSAGNILAKLEHDAQKGLLSREEAQRQAIAQIQNLRYGREMKDYFWIHDMYPRMVVHPYRPDLNGKDLTTFTDSEGKHIFVEMVKLVESKGDGYVEYTWQWKDEEKRIVPKISYVKGFAPWGWTIGTGIYLDDVKDEIAAITTSLIQISLFILLLISILLFYIDTQSYAALKKQQRAEHALRDSEEKYRTLVESAAEGMFMVLEGSLMYVNQTISEMLGYTQIELSGLKTGELFTWLETSPGNDYLRDLLAGRPVPERFETSLESKTGTRYDVTLSATRISLGGKSGFMAVVSDITHRKKVEDALSAREKKFRTMVHNLNVGFFRMTTGTDAVFVEANPALVALLGYDSRASLLAVPVSTIFIDQEEYTRLVVKAGEGELRREVTKIRRHGGSLFSASLWGVSISDDADQSQFFDGIMEDISDRFVREEAGRKLLSELQATVLFFNQHLENSRAIGHLNDTDHQALRNYSPSLLVREISDASTPEDIIRLNALQPYLIATLIASGAKPQSINSLTTSINDAIRQKLIECAIQELGTPPAAFAFMVFGSEGREEQTLHTDQDNAIVYEDVSQERELLVRNYFLVMGKKVCTWLNDAGYTFCKGNNMAMNPELCQPVAVWKNYFGTWIYAATGEDMLRAKIFFDFRSAYGDELIVDGLKDHLSRVVSENFRFLQILARDILVMEPPIGRFGKFIVETSGDNRGGLDIKKAMVPIVDFARIYALKHEIKAANTITRLDALRELKILTERSHQEMVQAYSFLMQMRLNIQADAVSSGSKQPDNIVFPKKLTSIEQLLLKEIFTQTKNYQTRLSYDFTGLPGDA